MRTAIVFVVGLVIGSALAPGFAQDTRIPGVNNMNHVAIVVPNLVDAIAFYTQKMGFKEGFTVKNDKGEPTLSYIQVSRDTFIELQPANATRQPGLNHFGLHVADIKSYVAELKKRGVTVTDPRQGRGDSMAANATDPGGMNIEIFQFGADSLQGQAISSWKQP
jgi:catechol 2,3-dioxygenase-like lactoylglutathione lyase family enzyme